MKRLRQLHLNLGILFAPSILFFALTGAYQTFRWNENGALGALTPIAAQMASIHKNAALQSESRRRQPRPAAASSGEARGEGRETQREGGPEAEREGRPEADRRDGQRGGGAAQGTQGAPRRDHSLPLKIYIFLMSLGLMVSTISGIVLGFKYNRSRRLIWGLLIAGTLLPLALLFVG